MRPIAMLGALLLSAAAASSVHSQSRDTSETPPADSVVVTSQLRILVLKTGDPDEMYALNDSARTADSLEMVRERQRADSIENAERERRAALLVIETARRDSLRLVALRRDSIEAVHLAAIARADSIRAAEERERQRLLDRYLFDGTGWYVGLAAGGAVPSGDFESLGYRSGYGVTLPIGWHRPNRALGVRLDLGYSGFSSEDFTGFRDDNEVVILNGSPQVWSAQLNATLRVPVNARRTVHLYGVGGGGFHHFRSFETNSALGAFLGDNIFANENQGFDETRTKFGVQLGGGVDFGMGPVSLFIESRLVNVFADREDDLAFNDFFGPNRNQSLRWVPITIGVNIR